MAKKLLRTKKLALPKKPVLPKKQPALPKTAVLPKATVEPKRKPALPKAAALPKTAVLPKKKPVLPKTALSSPIKLARAASDGEARRSPIRAQDAEKQLAEQRLRAVIEEYETNQEDIRASNEALQSANEELRSTLEELETSKKKLLSINEQLQAGDQENRNKLEELSGEITRRKLAEEALRASELQLATELTAMQQLHTLVTRLVTCTDLQSAMEEVLTAAMEITRAEKGLIQLLDTQLDALQVVAQRGFSANILDALPAVTIEDDSAGGRAWRAGTRVIIEDVNEDESYAPYRAAALEAGYRGVQATPLLSRDGELLGVLSTHYADPYRMTERDKHLLDLYAQQAADFIERTGAQNALRDSKVRLVAENLHKDEYLAMLGHELRNPIAAIRDAAELLNMADPQDPQLRHAYEVLARQSVHVARIIDGLLDMARLVRGKVQLQQGDVDLRSVVEVLLEEFAPKIEERGLSLERRLPDAPVWIRGDEVRLVQICDNLLGNAIKFTSSPGSITVDLRVQGECAALRIRDTGLGIRPDMLPLIFDSFQQERQDVARTTGGLGLGLALAKGLVELHKGTISARSDGLGRGAEFEVIFPLTTAPTTEQRALMRAPTPARRILIVEDNPDAGQMLRTMLHRRGHQVEVAESGLEALHMLHEQRVDVVLCDIGLPGMSGYDVARAIRQDPALHDIPLVALTGYGQPEDREQSATAGFNHHLVKPVDLLDLDGVLSRLGAAVGPTAA